ncbi:MAG: type II secretion system secretin GspD [Nitrospiraceae bacterium]|nr:MAG: type II secretion system secretin GspD [Nitrospiraceae bacterium]
MKQIFIILIAFLLVATSAPAQEDEQQPEPVQQEQFETEDQELEGLNEEEPEMEDSGELEVEEEDEEIEEEPEAPAPVELRAPPVPVPQSPAMPQPPVQNRNMVRPRPVPAPSAPAQPPVAAPGPVTPSQIKSFLSKPQEENYIILNFDNADLKDVINTVGSITNENFILSPGVDARITIHSAKKIPVSEVMNVFESVLEVNGISLVRSGEFFKVVSGSTAKQKPTEVVTGIPMEDVPDTDRPVTQIVPVQFVPVTEVSTILTPLLSQFGSIIPNPRNNLLIINDLSSSIIRILKVLKEIDVNAFQNSRMSFIRPKYSDVLSLSNELTEVLNTLNLTREGIALVPIERINSLVVFSASPTLLETVEGWIRKLDEEVMTGQNIFVYPVQNVKAEKIADILKTLYETTDGSKPRASTQQTQSSAAKKTAAPQRTTRSTSSRQSTGNSRVEIINFEPTNSLVILSPPGIYREIVKTIKKMDVYPREVLIEAVIAEVTVSDTDQYGIQWSVLHDIHVSGREDITGLVQQRTGLPAFTLPPDLDPISTTGSGLTYLFYRPEKFIGMIQALASKGKVNILSSPRLLVKDQEEASIEVGEDVPTATSTTSTTTTETLTQNIEYRTVGIKLKIKPTINDEKTVVLDLEQEVSDKGTDQQVGQEGNLFPSFTTTKTKTSIIVPDKQGIIIGGIMEDKKDKSNQGIPFLKDIPILGHLFRYDSSIMRKKELVIIITPHVITNKSEGDVLTSQFLGRLKEIKTFLHEEEIRQDEPAPENK